jgi:hypothetical protein
MNKTNWRSNNGNPLKIAEAIEAAGIEVLNVESCASNVDGGIWVSDDVAVAVATDGSYLRVTQQTAPGEFTHSPSRAFDNVAAIVSDIQTALSVT